MCVLCPVSGRSQCLKQVPAWPVLKNSVKSRQPEPGS